MLKSKYKAFEIQDDKVSETVMDGNLIAIADFIKNCKEGRPSFETASGAPGGGCLAGDGDWSL